MAYLIDETMTREQHLGLSDAAVAQILHEEFDADPVSESLDETFE